MNQFAGTVRALEDTTRRMLDALERIGAEGDTLAAEAVNVPSAPGEPHLAQGGRTRSIAEAPGPRPAPRRRGRAA